ncbi:MAG TPA: hypothetical protein EYG18_11175 [Micavibrio sp.]|nr:hypothetical protein [Micavibrio sp.]HIL29820.1 hypothetical protein [Micavibrio sp.]
MRTQDTYGELEVTPIIVLTHAFNGTSIGVPANLKASLVKLTKFFNSDSIQTSMSMDAFKKAGALIDLSKEDRENAISFMRWKLREFKDTEYLADCKDQIEELTDWNNTAPNQITLTRQYNKLVERVAAANKSVTAILLPDEHHPRHVLETPEEIAELVIDAHARTQAKAMIMAEELKHG